MALRGVKGALEETGERFVYLWGGYGTGKSHLLEAACRAMRLEGEGAAFVPLAEQAQLEPAMLQGIEHRALVCVDDLDQVAGDRDWEEGLFHLYNRARESGVRLLMAGARAPRALGLRLPDFRSRVAAMLVFQLRSLDDEQRVEVLQLRAREQGFELPKDAAAYLVQRQPRGMHSLVQLLERLDLASLAAQRRVTIPFIRGLLGGDHKSNRC